MSLLMEALRKAEEAKTKASQENTDETSVSFSSEQNPSQPKPEIPDTVEFESIPAPVTEIADTIVEIEKEKEKESFEEYEHYSSDHSDKEIENKTVIAPEALTEDLARDETEFEASSVADPVTQIEPTPQIDSGLLTEHHKRNNLENDNRDAINALFQAKRSTQKQRTKKFAAIAALLLLFPIGGGLYWLYSSLNQPSFQYPTPPLVASNQGLLEETLTAVATENLGDNDSDNAVTEPVTTTPNELSNNDINQESQEVEPSSPVTLAAVSPSLSTETIEPNIEQDSQQATSTGSTNTGPTISFTRTSNLVGLNPKLSSAYNDYQSGNYAEAFQQYQEVLALAPNDRNALLGLAATYLKQGNTPEAQTMYLRLLRLNPKDPIARTGLLSTTQSADPLRQELALKALLEEHPDVAPLAFSLGNLFASQNRWNEAQDAYFNASMNAKINTVGAVSPDYAFNLAISLERLNQLQPAYNYYQEALELSANSPPSFSMELLNQRLEYLEQANP